MKEIVILVDAMRQCTFGIGIETNRLGLVQFAPNEDEALETVTEIQESLINYLGRMEKLMNDAIKDSKV